MVTETAEIYRTHVRPYMHAKREEGQLGWVFNILEGRTEQEDVILRDEGHGPEDGFLMLPDLNWDRKSLGSLHLLALVQRRDIWSLRDLKRSFVPWLKYLRGRVLEATVSMYPGLEEDQIKLYVHCELFGGLHCVALCCTRYSGRGVFFADFEYRRPTDLLPFPYPCCQCYARSWCNAGNG